MANIVFWSGIFSPATADFSFRGTHKQRPIGTYQLSWWLRHHRFSSQVVEFLQLLTTKELIDLTEPFIKSDTLAIGVSTVFWATDGTVPQNITEAIDYFRTKYPKLKIIAGGNRSSRPEYEFLKFDKVFEFEAENSLLLYLQELKHSMRLPNLNFDITQLEHRFTERDVILENETLPIELGRGCIFKCKFCNYINIGKKKHTYQRNFDLIIDEMKYNKDHFNTTNYIFLDDTVNEDMDKVRNLSTFSKRLGFDIGWIGYLRADLIYRYTESPELLKQSGLLSPYFGLETFHPRAATSIGKGWNGKKAKDWIPILYNDLWNKEINIFGNFILGLPYESKESWVETLKWCNEHPYGTWNFYPLVLKVHHEDSALKSEFDKNYADYGYEVYQNNSWKRGDIDFRSALTYGMEYNRKLFEKNRPAGFAIANLLNLGYSYDQIKDKRLKDLANARDRALGFKQRYIEKYQEIIKHE